MRLRTVLNELPITGYYIHDEDLLEWDLIISPQWNVGSKGVVCLGSMADFLREGARDDGNGIMLVYVPGELDEKYRRPERLPGGVSPACAQKRRACREERGPLPLLPGLL